MLDQTLVAAYTKVNICRFPAGIYYIVLRGEAGTKVVKFEKM